MPSLLRADLPTDLCTLHNHLTAREQEVLFWCCHGKTAGEIATLLACATSTVNFHMNNLHSKFGIASTTYIAAISASRGLVTINAPSHLQNRVSDDEHPDTAGRRPSGDLRRDHPSAG